MYRRRLVCFMAAAAGLSAAPAQGADGKSGYFTNPTSLYQTSFVGSTSCAQFINARNNELQAWQKLGAPRSTDRFLTQPYLIYWEFAAGHISATTIYRTKPAHFGADMEAYALKLMTICQAHPDYSFNVAMTWLEDEQ